MLLTGVRCLIDDLSRIRKVKCDENFPICQRCFSTGRKCDGYGIWGGGGGGSDQQRDTLNDAGYAAHKIVATLPSKTFKTIISVEEQLSLDWFAHRTSIKLPGAFKSVFWNRIIFQVGSTEPAVLHAILALSSTHMRASLPSIDTKQSNIFTLQQYTAAINCLQPYFGRIQQESLRTTLVSCLVFIYLELLQSHYRVALLHLEHGLNVLKHQNDPNGRDRSIELPSFDARINDMFGRLYIQARLFGQDLQSSWFPSSITADHVELEPLLSNNQARRSLDVILFDILTLRDQFRALCPKPYTKTYSKLQADQLKLNTRLILWRKSYQPVFDASSDRPIILEFFAQQLLHLYHTMANIMVMASMSTDETIYNSYTDLFVSIVLQSVEIYKVAFAKRPKDTKYGAAFGHDTQRPNASADSVVDIGWVTPLYFVALKCRNWTVRNRALRLLRSAPHKEGVLDSLLAAVVAEKVMELEGQLYHGQNESDLLDSIDILDADEKKISQVAASVPASKMVQHVNIRLPEDANGSLTIECQRNRPLDKQEILIFTFDTALQTWTSRA